MAAKSIPGFSTFEDTWSERAPLGWDVLDTDVVARACVALLSDLLPMTTGEILHVDGGVHARRRLTGTRRRSRPAPGDTPERTHQDPVDERTDMLTPDELRARIATYVDAVNRRGPGAIAELFSEDGVQADPASSPANVGRAAIAEFFANGIAASDSWTFTAKAVHTCAAVVAIDFEISVETGGSTMVIDGIEVFTTDAEGLFTSVYAYWDDADLSFP